MSNLTVAYSGLAILILSTNFVGSVQGASNQGGSSATSTAPAYEDLTTFEIKSGQMITPIAGGCGILVPTSTSKADQDNYLRSIWHGVCKRGLPFAYGVMEERLRSSVWWTEEFFVHGVSIGAKIGRAHV